MKSPVVSIIMTHFNCPALALEGIQSIQRQTFTDWELLFFDDGSKEKPELPNDPRIRAFWGPDLPIEIRKSKTRYAVLNNQGLVEAKGAYITYLTHDNFYYPTRLERMVEYLETYPRVNTVYGPQDLFQLVEGSWVKDGVRTGPTIVLDPLHQVDHDSVMHRASVGRLAKGWPEDPKFWRDADGHFFRRLVKVGGPLRRVPGGSTDVHRFHDGSVTDLIQKGTLAKVLEEEAFGVA